MKPMVAANKVTRILDIGDPAHPRRIGAYHPTHEASFSSVVPLNQHAFVLESWWQGRNNLFTGLGVLDTRDPANPRRIG